MTHNTSTRHAKFAAAFAEQISAMTDPAAPTPVPEWTAQDVVDHILQWPVPVFANWAGLDLQDNPNDSLTDRWAARSRLVDAILTDDAVADEPVTRGPMAGLPLGQVIDRVYTADVFMHTWDLARANGQRPHMDAGYAAELLAGMRTIERVLRDSGQYGQAQATTSTDPVDQLIAFIGRDPQCTPAGG